MTTYLIADVREPDYWLTEEEPAGQRAHLVDLSPEFMERYEEAGRLYDGVQAELELIYNSKDI